VANERSEKSRYPSRYSPQKWVTAAQYVVEPCCEKKAKQEKKDLPIQFWNLKEWSAFYRGQIASANKLIKKHGEEAVIAALKSPKAAWMWSLRAPAFESLVLQERRNLALKPKTQEPPKSYDSIDINAKPRENFPSAYLADKLKDL